ncbi:uncharacterized protein N7483_011116 [Penicillium malachiteum]|uniref:uncharacterized protein n=1 Tax=Penicillium malachiteum TaxID=1324776 RepID=UPI0025477320|nr:uncharacterized protein N7483_011116 [Penicillium malachiteum]KAJ5713935.1 hypothetical protein N7483_011116 [Penicillium malachiteum]
MDLLIAEGFNKAIEIPTKLTLQPLIEIKKLPSFNRCFSGIMVMKKASDESESIMSQDLEMTEMEIEESPLEKARNVYGVTAFHDKCITSMVLDSDTVKPNKAVTTLLFIFVCDQNQVSIPCTPEGDWKTKEQLMKTYADGGNGHEWSDEKLYLV